MRYYYLTLLILLALQTSAQKSDSVYSKSVVSVPPEYVLGPDSMFSIMTRNIKVPESFPKDKPAGRSWIGFIVNTDSSISDITVKISFTPECDAEAMRVVGLLKKWKPGQLNGVQVRTRMSLPFTFANLDQAAVINDPDVQPSFPGGEEALRAFVRANTKYPIQARRMGTEGKFWIQFIVERDGALSNIELVKGIMVDCDKEALRVVSTMPHWIPGKKHGLVVRVRSAVPFNFKLEENGKYHVQAY